MEVKHTSPLLPLRDIVVFPSMVIPLFVGRDKFDLEDNNLLYPPHKILPSNPSTTGDYRKLIVDSINNVQNAWVYPEKDNLQNIAGLYSVKVQLKDNSGKNIIDKSIKEVYNLLMQNRSIGTDFISITPLRKDEIKFEATITLDSFAVGEEVLAHIFKNIEEATSALTILIDEGADAIELMDDASLRTAKHIQNAPYNPSIIVDNSAGLLFEFQRKNQQEIDKMVTNGAHVVVAPVKGFENRLIAFLMLDLKKTNCKLIELVETKKQ